MLAKFPLRKIVQIRSFSGLYFPAFGLNTEISGANLRSQSKIGKIRTQQNSVFGHFSRSIYLTLARLTNSFLSNGVVDRSLFWKDLIHAVKKGLYQLVSLYEFICTVKSGNNTQYFSI